MPLEQKATIEREAVARFSGLAGEWWNPEGAFRMLHKMHPCRLSYIQKCVSQHWAQSPGTPRPLSGKSVLDIGCGGGLLCESMARLGARVCGVDASEETILVAKNHSDSSRLGIEYKVGGVESLLRSRWRFDIITAMEVVEHVERLDVFMGALATLLKPKGMLVISTVNRTALSYVFGVLAAEYLFDWVPLGTHQWTKFVRPSEMGALLESEGFALTGATGMVFDTFTGAFYEAPHRMGINYMMTAILRERVR